MNGRAHESKADVVAEKNSTHTIVVLAGELCENKVVRVRQGNLETLVMSSTHHSTSERTPNRRSIAIKAVEVAVLDFETFSVEHVVLRLERETRGGTKNDGEKMRESQRTGIQLEQKQENLITCSTQGLMRPKRSQIPTASAI